jgi:hypothetical protein
VLTGAEREQLARSARRGKTSQVLALRAKIVLACAGGRVPLPAGTAVRVGQAPMVKPGLAGQPQRPGGNRDDADLRPLSQHGHRQQLAKVVIGGDGAAQRVLHLLVHRPGASGDHSASP